MKNPTTAQVPGAEPFWMRKNTGANCPMKRDATNIHSITLKSGLRLPAFASVSGRSIFLYDALLGRLKKFEGDMKSFDGSVAIYEALKDIVREYSLSGLTIRCLSR